MTAPEHLPSVGWTEVFDSIEIDAFEELAGEVSRAPIAMVTLVDENRLTQRRTYLAYTAPAGEGPDSTRAERGP